MSTMGLEVFDKTVHQTNDWLKDLAFEMGWEDRHRAYLAMRACLHTLRDRLTADEAVHLGAQLPMLIRGFYYEGWKPSEVPKKIRDKDAFVSEVAAAFGDMGPDDPEDLVRALFKQLQFRISEGEIEDIKQELPKQIEALWPQKV